MFSLVQIVQSYSLFRTGRGEQHAEEDMDIEAEYSVTDQSAKGVQELLVHAQNGFIEGTINFDFKNHLVEQCCEVTLKNRLMQSDPLTIARRQLILK